MKKIVFAGVLCIAAAFVPAKAQSPAPSVVVESITTNYDNNKNPRQTVQNLFDRNANTKWFAESFDKTGYPVTIEWAYDSPGDVAAYRLTSGNDIPKRDPMAWTLYGSKDGKKYVKIDSQNGKKWSEEERKAVQTFKLSKTAKGMKHFRLEITKLVGNEKPQLSEIELVFE